MNRDELIDKLALDMAPNDWPTESVGNQGVAFRPAEEYSIALDGCRAIAFTYEQYIQRRAELINKPSWDDAPEWAEWLAQDADGEWRGFREEPRVGPNGDHWFTMAPIAGSGISEGAVPAGHDWRQSLERRPAFNESRADIIGQNGNDGDHYETSTYCGRCGGEYWTPPHEYCPCLDGVGSGKQSRYQDHSRDDWIDEFARTATVEEFRGAMRFTIGKYNRRMGRKDEIAQEVRKMRDYCDRWLSYEEGQ